MNEAYAIDSFNHYNTMLKKAVIKYHLESYNKLDEAARIRQERRIFLRQYPTPRGEEYIEEVVQMYTDMIEEYAMKIDKIKKGDYTSLHYSITDILETRDRFQPSNKVIGHVWKCKFSIINPYFNNAKQTITNYYLFNPSNTQLLRRINN